MNTRTFSTQAEWLDALAEQWQTTGGQAVHQRGMFHVCLSADPMLEPLYRHLAKLSDWPWNATHLFISDEYFVSSEHSKSCYKKIYEAFYPRKIHIERWKTELPKEKVAVDYEQTMRRVLSEPPRFDLMLLPLEQNGSTAGLYPGTEAFEEKEKRTALNHIPQKEEFRLTITFPAINLARETVFASHGAIEIPETLLSSLAENPSVHLLQLVE